MKSRIIKCPVKGLNVNKEDHCPDKRCDTCPDNLKGKQILKKSDLTPAVFSDVYINNKIEIPFYFQPTRGDIKEIMTKFRLRNISLLRLERSLEEKLYCALYEMKYAIEDSEKWSLRKLNLKINKKRKPTIKQLKKVIESDCLSYQTIIEIEKDIKLLENYDVPSDEQYHPLDELRSQSEFLISCKSGSLQTICNENRKWTHVPLKQRPGRPSHFLWKTLQIIVFKLLHEHANIPIEKARELTAKIINEFFNKCDERKIHFEIGTFRHTYWDPQGRTTFQSITNKNVEDSLQNADII
jgi:hypothetical protein